MRAKAWTDYVPEEYILNQGSLSVDLGCGRFPRNPLRAGRLVGIDIFQDRGSTGHGSYEYRRAIPGNPLPILDSEADCISAFDFLEHIPRWERSPGGEAMNPFIEIMNEIYRSLKVNGIFIALTPCFPSPAAFGDPTHVNFISEGTYEYFAKNNFANTLGYGFNGNFEVISVRWIESSGVLWNSKISEASDFYVPKSVTNKLKSKIGNALRTIRSGHDGKTHQLWVFRKI